MHVQNLHHLNTIPAPATRRRAYYPPPALLILLIQQRQQAKADKNWAEADRIRDELKDQGVMLEDKGSQTTWRRE